MSHLHKALLKTTNMRPPGPPPRGKPGQSKDYTPLSWKTYFDASQEIKINANTFRVYLSGTEGPILALLHGGGYSALTWALFTREIVQKIQCRVVAIDIRGHGETQTDNDDNLDIDNLTDDVVNILAQYSNGESVVFIGHSMGGALAVHASQKLPNCVGLVVIDVVEGTALDSLTSMQTFLRNRPNSFINTEHAIQWCVRSGQTHNLESARVSMPGQIKNTTTGKLAASELDHCQPTVEVDTDVTAVISQINKQTPSGIEVISENDETDEAGALPASQNAVADNAEASEAAVVASEAMKPPSSYTWRINLSKTEVYWKGWFENLSELFLNTPVPKLLLLANIHGLDTALTVGQMQGKFQMQVLPKCGHAIHEDLPDKVADIIASYLVRQKLTVGLSDFISGMPGC